jgi:hypothetical protein
VVGGPLAYYSLKTLDSHDFKVGFRWQLDSYVPSYQPPLMRKG